MSLANLIYYFSHFYLSYWDNSAIWCGNVNQDLALSGCGRCGDVLGETHFQQGGEYDKGMAL